MNFNDSLTGSFQFLKKEANLQIGVKPPNEKNYTSHIAPKSRHDKQTCKGDHFADLGFRSAAAVSRI